MSFIILGNYGLAQQMKYGLDITGFIGKGGEMYDAILMIFNTLPLPSLEEEPARKIRGFWALLLIFLPVGLLFAQNSLYSLQGVTIIAAFPVGILLVMIVVSFFKDCKKWMAER